jgi:formiminotetrahydrofolate cyclodeaminase
VSQLASNRPAPGGGSAAALAGALGAALGEMVANFTVGKKKYAHVEDEVSAALQRLTEARNELLSLTDADADAYTKVGAAYGMPKETDAEKAARAEAIEEALKAAAEVPRQVALVAAGSLEQFPVLLEKGNQNLVSDVGVGAKLALAAVECAWLNVEINLASMKDEEHIERLRTQMQDTVAKAANMSRQLWDATVERVCG